MATDRDGCALFPGPSRLRVPGWVAASDPRNPANQELSAGITLCCRRPPAAAGLLTPLCWPNPFMVQQRGAAAVGRPWQWRQRAAGSRGAGSSSALVRGRGGGDTGRQPAPAVGARLLAVPAPRAQRAQQTGELSPSCAAVACRMPLGQTWTAASRRGVDNACALRRSVPTSVCSSVCKHR